jgi:hypothetical protein
LKTPQHIVNAFGSFEWVTKKRWPHLPIKGILNVGRVATILWYANKKKYKLIKYYYDQFL